jgi:putative membrane protein
MEKVTREKRIRIIVWTLTLAVPAIVTLLYFIPAPESLSEEVRARLFLLPRLNALLNGTAFLCLGAALWAIRNKRVALHRRLTTTAMGLSVLFLLSYVVFHLTTDSTPYGGEGFMRPVYFFILLTHILLSAIVLPLVLFTFVRGYLGEFEKHRKIARITWPIWMYVTATGVMVYFMIAPYYPH